MIGNVARQGHNVLLDCTIGGSSPTRPSYPANLTPMTYQGKPDAKAS
jgi:hypothetical protein